MTAGKIELKSCPFCGSEPFLKQYHDQQSGYDTAEFVVICTKCNMGVYCPEEEAIKAWNTRSIPSVEPDVNDMILDVKEYEAEQHIGTRPTPSREVDDEKLYSFIDNLRYRSDLHPSDLRGIAHAIAEALKKGELG